MLIQTDLRFLLPIQPEQTIIILGHYASLAEAISSANSTVINFLLSTQEFNPGSAHLHQALIVDERWPLPLTRASADHIIAPIIPQHQAIAMLLDEASRILKPGGWFFFGIHSPSPVNRLPFISSMLRILLQRQDFHQAMLYGAYPGLKRPRYLIPLVSSGSAYHFYQRIFVPRSSRGLLAQRLAVLLARLGLQRILFNDFGFIAQRS